MGRKNTKKPGALVKLYRRRKPGIGIILEVTDTDSVRQFARERFKIRFKSKGKIKERLGYGALYEYRRDGAITEDERKMVDTYLMYGTDSRNRKIAKVQWITYPSAWETTTLRERVEWYPFDMLRTVSAVKR
jgi:hypothetical protein